MRLTIHPFERNNQNVDDIYGYEVRLSGERVAWIRNRASGNSKRKAKWYIMIGRDDEDLRSWGKKDDYATPDAALSALQQAPDEVIGRQG